MIRRLCALLSGRQCPPALILSLAFLAEPCLAIADSQTKKPPQKPTPPPQQQQPTTPSHTSRVYKYQSLDKYHPHAKSASKATRSSHH